MSEQRLKGLLSIEMADIPSSGLPAENAWAVVGRTYRDEASLTEDDPSEVNHYSNEADDPEESDMTAGAKKLAFTLIDFDPDTLVKFMGGEKTGTTPDFKWEAPASKSKIEKAFRITSKNGRYIILPRVSFIGKLDYKLAPTGIAKVIVTGTVLAPLDTYLAPVIKGNVQE